MVNSILIQRASKTVGENLCLMLFKYIQNWLVFIVAMLHFLQSFGYFYLEPVLPLYLINYYKKSETETSIIMSLLPISFMLSFNISHIIGKYRIASINFAVFSMGLSFLLVGPTHSFLPFLPEEIYVICIS